jgi:hypothetical protein
MSKIPTTESSRNESCFIDTIYNDMKAKEQADKDKALVNVREMYHNQVVANFASETIYQKNHSSNPSNN